MFHEEGVPVGTKTSITAAPRTLRQASCEAPPRLLRGLSGRSRFFFFFNSKHIYFGNFET